MLGSVHVMTFFMQDVLEKISEDLAAEDMEEARRTREGIGGLEEGMGGGKALEEWKGHSMVATPAIRS